MAHVTTLVFFSAWTGETPLIAMESWSSPPGCTLRTLRGTGAALYTVLKVLLDSQEPTQAYKFDVACFCKPSHPTRAERTLCEDHTRFGRSRYQTRPLAFPALHQLCTTSLQHSLILPSHSSTSGAHLKLLEHALRGAHTRHTCHICTQRPSYEYDDPPFATHYHAKRPTSGGRRARQPRLTCPCRKILAIPNLVLYHAEGRPQLQHPPSPCRLPLPAKHVALAPPTRPQTVTSIL